MRVLPLLFLVACDPALQALEDDAPSWADLGLNPSSEVAPLPVEAAPTGVVFDQTSLIPGQPVSFRVVGLGPGDEVVFARSLAGLGDGPCFPNRGGICLDILPPVSPLGSAIADASGNAVLTLTLPDGLQPQFLYTQAVVDSFAGDIVTNTITAPILIGALDEDGDGWCAGNTTCQDPNAIPGDCQDDDPDVNPGQLGFFEAPYTAVDGSQSYDYDCDGRNEPFNRNEYTCSPGNNPNLPIGFCSSSSSGWDGGVPFCGEVGTWGNDCFTFGVAPLLFCGPLNPITAVQTCR